MEGLTNEDPEDPTGNKLWHCLFLNANVYTFVTLFYILTTTVQWWPTVITQQTVYTVLDACRKNTAAPA